MACPMISTVIGCTTPPTLTAITFGAADTGAASTASKTNSVRIPVSLAYRYPKKQVVYNKILVRATNWVGDAVMSLPALRALRQRFPDAEISILAKPWVADLYGREPFCDRMIPYTPRNWREKWRAGRDLASERFDCAILLQNAFEAAAVAFAA